MIRYGVELEVVGLGDVQVFSNLRDLLPEYNFALHRSNNQWNVGTDGSMGEDGAEIRSPIMVGNYDLVFPVITALKIMDARVNKLCGFHVHISMVDGRKLNARVIENIFKCSVRNRMGYTHRISEYAKFGKYFGKYCAVRQVTDTHVEFRMFNMTLNSHGVANYLRQVTRTINLY